MWYHGLFYLEGTLNDKIKKKIRAKNVEDGLSPDSQVKVR
jgi:hypothetical protein